MIAFWDRLNGLVLCNRRLSNERCGKAVRFKFLFEKLMLQQHDFTLTLIGKQFRHVGNYHLELLVKCFTDTKSVVMEVDIC